MPSYKDLNIDYQGGHLYVMDKSLETLDGCPSVISGTFECQVNWLPTLVGGPSIVNGSYGCIYNRLTDLVGCASHIGGMLYCHHNNQITSLVGIHKIIKSCQGMYFDAHNIIHGGIGLLMIENLTDISSDNEQFKIIKSYLGKGTKGMMECRAELIAKGYNQYAKL